MITVDRAIGDKWLITDGLKPGDRLIVEGMQKVRPGASVKVASFDASGKDSSDTAKKALPAAKTK